MSENLREEVLTEAFGRLPGGPVIVVETGTLRDPQPAARKADGWSTLCLAGLLNEREVDTLVCQTGQNTSDGVSVTFAL